MAPPAVPKTQAVADGIVALIESAISQTIPLLPKSWSRVVSKALAAQHVLLYKYAGFSFLQLFVQHATYEETEVNGRVIRPLLEWGRLIGVTDPEPATRAELTIQVTVQTQSGDIPAGAALVRPSTGAIYNTVSAFDLDASTKQVNIRATPDYAGAVGNLIAGDTVEFANPEANIARVATVVTQVTAGVDAESVESYRSRILRKFQARPQGGAYADYREWGEEVAGIVNVYPYTADNPGEVDIFAEATEASSGSADGIPTAGQLQGIRDSINLDSGGQATRRPANAAINVYAISRTAFDLTISGLSADADGDLAGLKTNIENGVEEFLRSREPFIVGLHVLPRRDRITDAQIAGVVSGIVDAAGGSLAEVTLTQGGQPLPAYTLGHGEKAKSGTFSYI